MRESNTPVEYRIVTSVQILLLILFYSFAVGVISFVSYGVYRSWINDDGWVHATIIASLVIFVFLILIFVVTVVFRVTMKEGQK